MNAHERDAHVDLVLEVEHRGRRCLHAAGEIATGDHRQPLRTDEGHYILDLDLKRIGNPRQLALVLNQIPGVVENGLFIDICDIVVIGSGDGRVTVRDINSGRIEDSQVDLAEGSNIFADLGD